MRLVNAIVVTLILIGLAACGPGGAQFGPPGTPSISNYNPISGNRGGSSASS